MSHTDSTDTVIRNIEAKYGLYRLHSYTTGRFLETWLVGTKAKFCIQRPVFKNGFEIVILKNDPDLFDRLVEGKSYFKRFENAVIRLRELEDDE